MNISNIKTVQYQAENGENVSLLVTFNDDSNCCVPLVLDNTDYAEILKQVKEGTLTIKDAE
tara:strand:+ start:1075 stop:1257 length:183 start_codon:yes stop_codon:yes gene_type:complete